MGKLIRSIRAALRKRFPTANELVYDNYNFFVIGYSPTERPTDYIVSLAANAKGVGLSFNHGADLPDPGKILLGAGKQNRFIRLPMRPCWLSRKWKRSSARPLRMAEPLPARGGGCTIMRSVAVKQRPRRNA